MTEPIAPRGRYGESIAAEVAALEADIRHRVVDLEEAFTGRDWATVARIYREVAAVADRLEQLDPNAYVRDHDAHRGGDGDHPIAASHRARGRGVVRGHLALTAGLSNTCFGVPKRPSGG